MLKKILKTNCLRHTIKNLNLGSVYLKHKDFDDIPRLTTIYELHGVIENAYEQIENIRKELPKNNNEFALKGMFTLVVTQFEIVLLDLTSKIIKLYPEKLATFSKKDSDPYEGQATLLGFEKYIDFKIHKLGYKNIEAILKKLLELLKADQSDTVAIDANLIDNLIEIKETRNLLLHNNLVVNQFYLQNTKGVKRSDRVESILTIDKAYVVTSIKTIQTIIENIQSLTLEKFESFTLIELFKRLWIYTFTNTDFVTIEKFCTLNYENNSIDGPFKIDSRYSSSETLYMEFWMAQRTSAKSQSSFSMVNLGYGAKLAFLADFFGELRMTYW